MNNYLVWTLTDDTSHIKIEFLTNDIDESQLHDVQKYYTNKGYLITEVIRAQDGRTILNLYKVDGISDFIIIVSSDLNEGDK